MHLPLNALTKKTLSTLSISTKGVLDTMNLLPFTSAKPRTNSISVPLAGAQVQVNLGKGRPSAEQFRERDSEHRLITFAVGGTIIEAASETNFHTEFAINTTVELTHHQELRDNLPAKDSLLDTFVHIRRGQHLYMARS